MWLQLKFDFNNQNQCLIESVFNASHSTRYGGQAAGCERKEEQSLTESPHEGWYPSVSLDQREMGQGHLEGARAQTYSPGDTDEHLQKDHQVLGFCPQSKDGESHRARALAKISKN